MEQRRPHSNSRLVYSTDGGRVQPPPAKAARPAPRVLAPSRPPDDGVVRVQRDRRGRGGKTATAVTGLPGSDVELDALLARLKSTLGTGGSRDGRALVLQGDQRERLMAELTKLGFKPKLAGG